MNRLFPLSVSVGTLVVAWLAYTALRGELDNGEAIGRILLATMLAMGVLEHWMLVLPISPSALWRWALRHEDRSSPAANRPAPASPSMGAASGANPVDPGSASLRIEHDEKLLHARSA
jgi:hypothetical protein